VQHKDLAAPPEGGGMEVAGVEPARKHCRSKYLCCHRVYYCLTRKDLRRMSVASYCHVLTKNLSLFSISGYITGYREGRGEVAGGAPATSHSLAVVEWLDRIETS